MPDLDDLLTTAQTAEILGKTPRAVQRMVVRGALIPATTLPGKTGAHLFERAVVERIKAEAAVAA